MSEKTHSYKQYPLHRTSKTKTSHNHPFRTTSKQTARKSVRKNKMVEDRKWRRRQDKGANSHHQYLTFRAESSADNKDRSGQFSRSPFVKTNVSRANICERRERFVCANRPVFRCLWPTAGVWDFCYCYRRWCVNILDLMLYFWVCWLFYV